jgi:tetratricopeptide (TPR) repeat protein
MHQTAVDTPADLSGVVIPKAGISVDSVAASLRSILPGGWRHEISGEFTAAGSRLDLLLRLNGRKLFSVSDAGPDAADRLIALGALIVVANTQPYVAASYLCETNKAAALAAAVQIIAALPPRDENVARAYNMEGIIAEDQGRVDEAVRIYQQTIHDYPHFAIPYNNLGVIWANQHRTEDAIAEYRAAIRLDPKYASPHYNLGFALRELAESGGPSNRTRRLLDACAAFTAGAKLAADDPDYQRQMRMTDTLLAGKGHCPPK